MSGKSIVNWMDRDWQKRRYVPLFAIGQRLVWIAPTLVVILVIELFQLRDSNPITLWLVIFGIVCSLFLFGLSMYRWLVGFGKTGQMTSRFDQSSTEKSNG